MSGVEGRAMPDLDHSHDNEYQKLFLMHMDPPVVNSKHSHCCARVLRLDTVETSEAMRKLASVCLLLWMSGLVTARRELSTNASPTLITVWELLALENVALGESGRREDTIRVNNNSHKKGPSIEP